MADIDLRRAARDDTARLIEVHRTAVESLGASFYTRRQRRAWADEAVPEAYAVDDEDRPLVVATIEGTIAGFGQLDLPASELDMLFVDPAYTERGVGSRLLHHLEGLASNASTGRLTLDASLNAANFYHRADYAFEQVVDKRLPLHGEDVVYPTIRMVKDLP